MVWSAIAALGGWHGDVLDIGCGTGFHLQHFATSATSVVGVEPHQGLAAIARRRVRRIPSISVVEGLASALPLASSSVDFAHARWAYFFGPGCEPGLAELGRVMRSGGLAVILDNDPTRSTFGSWFRSGFPDVAPVDAFWAAQGWARVPILASWRFESREDLEAVVRIELPTAAAEAALESWDALEVDYAVNLWWKRF